MKSVVFVALLAVAVRASAAGFAVGEQGAAAMGQASAVTASRGDPSAAYFNPASTAGEQGLALSVGVTLVAPMLTATDPGGGPTTGAAVLVQTPPTLCATWGSGPLGLGLYFGVPFGSSLAWPDGWRGRYEVVGISLNVFTLAPFLAYRVHERISLAAGVEAHFATVRLERQLDFVDREGHVLLGGAGHGVGLTASALFDVATEWRAGLTYRSRAYVGFGGRAHFEDVPYAFEAIAHDQDVSTAVTLPDRLALGGEWHRGPWRLGAEVDYTFWQTLQSFDVDFATPATPDLSQPKRWHGTFTVRAGGTWRSEARPLTLRAGFFYDQTPSPSDTLSPTLPDSDRVGASVGAGWRFGPLGVDAAYMLVVLTGASTTGDEVPAAHYGGTAHLLALGLSWRG